MRRPGAETDEPSAAKGPRERLGFRVAAFTLVVLVLAIGASLPFVISGVFRDLLQPPSDVTYEYNPPNPNAGLPYTRISYDLIALDEWQQTVTMRVIGRHICGDACSDGLRMLFISVTDAKADEDRLPSTVAVTIPPSDTQVTQEIKLPVSGQPLRYPFDTYRLGVGMILQRVLPDGTLRTLTLPEVADHLSISIHMRIPRVHMSKPVTVPAKDLPQSSELFPLLEVDQVTFSRPLYLKVLTVVLILLVASASAYAVLMRPLHELVIGTGAIVLGLRSVRNILLGSAAPGSTVVDLALSVIILFILTAITLRALRFTEARGDLYLTRRRPQPTEEPTEASTGSASDADAIAVNRAP